jgi:hypothetical protein
MHSWRKWRDQLYLHSKEHKKFTQVSFFTTNTSASAMQGNWLDHQPSPATEKAVARAAGNVTADWHKPGDESPLAPSLFPLR